MQPETEQTITELLQYVREGVEKGAEFVGEQAPLVAQEIVLRGRITETAGVLLGVGFLTAAGIFVKKSIAAWKTHNEREDDRDEDMFFMLAMVKSSVVVVSAIAGGVISGNCFTAAATVWFAPRLYVLDYLRGLL